jgi:hypothetical protein
MTKIYHAPYIYLEKQNRNTYNFFVRIFHYDHDEIRFNEFDGIPFEQTNGSILCSIDIIHNEVNESKMFNKKIKINTDNIRSFDENTFCIIIKVNINSPRLNTVVENKTVIYFSNADIKHEGNFIPRIGDDREIAYNCPYLYLSNPNAPDGNGLYPNEFQPFYSASLSNFQAQENTDEIIIADNRLLKIGHRRAIVLSSQTNNSDEVSSEVEKYLDDSLEELEGFFEVVIADGPESNYVSRRRGKLRNADSDTDSNSFFDTNPFL